MTETPPVPYYEHYWSAAGGHTQGRLRPHQRDLYECHIPVGARSLDLGCGDGLTSGPWLAERGTYVGVDLSRVAVDHARTAGLDARVIEDAALLPFADGEFDAVVCVEVLEHLLDPLAAAREARRVLRLDGVLIVTVPNAVYWRRRADMLIGHWNPLGDELSASEPWRAPHIRFFSAKILRKMLIVGGFRDTKIAGHQGGFLSDLPILRRYFPPTRVYGFARDRLPSLLSYTLSAVAIK